MNRSKGTTLAARLSVAESLPARTRGLLGRRELPAGEGLLLRPCLGIHTFFMKFPIDVVFLDRGNRVIAAVSGLKPHRMTRVIPRSAGAIELPAGTVKASNTSAGDEVAVE